MLLFSGYDGSIVGIRVRQDLHNIPLFSLAEAAEALTKASYGKQFSLIDRIIAASLDLIHQQANDLNRARAERSQRSVSTGYYSGNLNSSSKSFHPKIRLHLKLNLKTRCQHKTKNSMSCTCSEYMRKSAIRINELQVFFLKFNL